MPGYVYDGGSSTPGLAGLVEVAGTSPLIRINSSPLVGALFGGTFKTSKLPFEDTPPVRVTGTPFPTLHGGRLGPALYDEWAFTIPGWLWVPSGPDDVPAAQSQLGAAFAASNGPVTLVANMRSWATRRQWVAQTNGPITFTPKHGTYRIPTRDFTIPMVAPDPIGYDADNLRTKDIPMTGAATAVTSAGNVDVPFTARFVGPFTNPTLTRASDGASLTLAMLLTAGQYVDVSTFGPLTAVLFDGSNQFGTIGTPRSATRIRPGTNNWSASASAGATGASKVTFTWRDGWVA